MSKQETVTSRQFAFLVMLFSIGTTVLYIPGSAAGTAEQDGWSAIVIGTAAGAAMIGFYLLLARRRPKQHFFEWCESLLGKWLGALVSFFCVTASLVGGVSTLLYYVGDFMVTQIMTETPMVAIHAIFAAFMFWGLRLGLATLGRASEILGMVVIAVFVLLFVLVSPKFEMDNLRPILHTPFKKDVLAGFEYFSFSFLPMFVLLAIFPSKVRGERRFGGSLFKGALTGSLIILLVTLACILVLSARQTSTEMFPSFILARKVDIAGVLTRIEILFTALWIIALFFKTALYMYFSALWFEHWFRLKDYRSVLAPLTILAVYLSLSVYPDSAYQNWWDGYIWPILAMCAGLGVPLLLLIASAVKPLTFK